MTAPSFPEIDSPGITPVSFANDRVQTVFGFRYSNQLKLNVINLSCFNRDRNRYRDRYRKEL
jgi:hypothetical protein